MDRLVEPVHPSMAVAERPAAPAVSRSRVVAEHVEDEVGGVLGAGRVPAAQRGAGAEAVSPFARMSFAGKLSVEVPGVAVAAGVTAT